MVEPFWKEKLRSLPEAPGVYLMRDAQHHIIYIGKAVNLKRRLSSYFRSDAEEKAAAIVNSLRHIDYLLASSEREALILERQLINDHQPYFNSMWRDDKSYPYLKLTLKEDFPRLFLTRQRLRDGSEYFGPFPQVQQIKHLLRWLQRYFRWRPCKLTFNHTALPAHSKVKSCLYYHTERCPGPCMGHVTQKEYHRGINELRLFLRGRYRRLENVWEKEMKEASRDMEFENAADLRDRLAAIRSMEEKVTVREISPEELEFSLSVTRTLEELKNVLGLAKWPIVIEGFDISNTSGTESVGSMVRFHNARPDKSGYRKFRIRTVQGVDDFSMIKEVVYRRYRRLKVENESFPDLILIDGGKGQLASALQSLGSLGINIPVISLAKRKEEIYRPGESEPLSLPPNSAALRLLQAIRDESHRFAVTFHRLRRAKAMGLND